MGAGALIYTHIARHFAFRNTPVLFNEWDFPRLRLRDSRARLLR